MIDVIRRSAFYQRLTATHTQEPENISASLDAVRSAIHENDTKQQHPAEPNRALIAAIDSLYHSERPVEEVIELISARCTEMKDRLLKLEQDAIGSKNNLATLEQREVEQVEAYQIAVIQDEAEAAALWSNVTEIKRQVEAQRVKLEAFNVGITELKEAISTYSTVYNALFTRSRLDHMKKYHDDFVRTAGAEFIEALNRYDQEIKSLGIGYRPNHNKLLSGDAIDYIRKRLSLTITTEATTEQAH